MKTSLIAMVLMSFVSVSAFAGITCNIALRGSEATDAFTLEFKEYYNHIEVDTELISILDHKYLKTKDGAGKMEWSDFNQITNQTFKVLSIDNSADQNEVVVDVPLHIAEKYNMGVLSAYAHCSGSAMGDGLED